MFISMIFNDGNLDKCVLIPCYVLQTRMPSVNFAGEPGLGSAGNGKIRQWPLHKESESFRIRHSLINTPLDQTLFGNMSNSMSWEW